jgi:DNA-binding LytR/AlgR family response regulator
MQDHYVRAETPLGSAMILMRFSDAVAELGPTGMQVHRSWWVARDAVASLEREGRRTRVRLANGAVVPVSSAFLPAVREALGRNPGEGFDSTTLAAKSRKGEGPGRAAPGTIP